MFRKDWPWEWLFRRRSSGTDSCLRDRHTKFPRRVLSCLSVAKKRLFEGKSFLLSVLSGAVEIPCAVIGAMLFSSGGYMAFALAFAAGAMTAVTVTELIADAFSERNSPALFAFSLGFCFIMFLDLLFA